MDVIGGEEGGAEVEAITAEKLDQGRISNVNTVFSQRSGGKVKFWGKNY